MPDDKQLYKAIAKHAHLQEEWLVLKRQLWATERRMPQAAGRIARLEAESVDARKLVHSAKYQVQIELDKLMDAYRYWLMQKAGEWSQRG